MATPTTQPSEVDMKELQTLISGKKKESSILPLLEKLFPCLVDTDKWLFLAERTYLPRISRLETQNEAKSNF